MTRKEHLEWCKAMAAGTIREPSYRRIVYTWPSQSLFKWAVFWFSLDTALTVVQIWQRWY